MTDSALEKKERCKFTSIEDKLLQDMVIKYGKKNWSSMSKHLPGKTPRQCRERYIHYLAPDLNSEPWKSEEDEKLLKLFSEYGPKWAFFKQKLQGRSTVNIKNRWATLSRRIEKCKNSTKLNFNTEESDKEDRIIQNMNIFMLKIIPISLNLFSNDSSFEDDFVYNIFLSEI